MVSAPPGYVKKLKTTVPITPEEAMEAMQKAGGVKLRRPGA